MAEQAGMTLQGKTQQGMAPKIDPELAYEAAVSIALGSGAISRSGEASPEHSRFTDSSYVLMGSAGTTLQRIPRAEILAELERLARINGNLEHYRLRFGPGRWPVLTGLFLGAAAMLSVQVWVNVINERRLAALEQSYLEHQASLDQGAVPSELASLESIGEFESRLLRARFDGCYGEVRDSLARAAERLGSVETSGSREESSLRLSDAQGAYEEFKASRDSCRQAMRRFLPRPFQS